MSAVVGAQCPECGRLQAREGRFFRTRRRWRIAAVGLTLLSISWALPLWPRVENEGWTGAVPSTVLIPAMRWLNPLERESRDWANFIGQSWQARLWTALDTRAKGNEMWPWQRRMMLRCFKWDCGRRRLGAQAWATVEGEILVDAAMLTAGHKDDEFFDGVIDVASVEVRTREKWPLGVPVYGSVRPYRLVYWSKGLLERDSIRWSATPTNPTLKPWSGQQAPPMLICGNELGREAWTDGLVVLGTPTRTGVFSYAARAELGQPDKQWRVVCENRTVGRFEVVTADSADPVAAVLKPVGSTKFEEALRQPGVASIIRRYSQHVRINTELLSGALIQLDATFAAHIELMRGRTVVGSTHVWWRALKAGSQSVVVPMAEELVFTSESGGEVLPTEEGEWSLRIHGDGETALRDLDSTRYWDGKVVIPVQEREMTVFQPL